MNPLSLETPPNRVNILIRDTNEQESVSSNDDDSRRRALALERLAVANTMDGLFTPEQRDELMQHRANIVELCNTLSCGLPALRFPAQVSSRSEPLTHLMLEPRVPWTAVASNVRNLLQARFKSGTTTLKLGRQSPSSNALYQQQHQEQTKLPSQSQQPAPTEALQSSQRPVIHRFPATEMDIFGSSPTCDVFPAVSCLSCKRIVYASRFAEHVQTCERVAALKNKLLDVTTTTAAVVDLRDPTGVPTSATSTAAPSTTTASTATATSNTTAASTSAANPLEHTSAAGAAVAGLAGSKRGGSVLDSDDIAAKKRAKVESAVSDSISKVLSPLLLKTKFPQFASAREAPAPQPERPKKIAHVTGSTIRISSAALFKVADANKAHQPSSAAATKFTVSLNAAKVHQPKPAQHLQQPPPLSASSSAAPPAASHFTPFSKKRALSTIAQPSGSSIQNQFSSAAHRLPVPTPLARYSYKRRNALRSAFISFKKYYYT